jgi:hypothetical protein
LVWAAGTVHHLAMAGVDAAQAKLYDFAAANASMPEAKP